jgi:hypothetical protein
LNESIDVQYVPIAGKKFHFLPELRWIHPIAWSNKPRDIRIRYGMVEQHHYPPGLSC